MTTCWLLLDMTARVTFYFVFVSFYARRLLIIALLSIPVYVTYRVLRKEKVIAILRWVFSIGLVLWTTVFLEMWKRRNANINIEWGLDDYKEDTADDTRAQYVGDIRYGFYCEGGFVSLADLVEATTDEQLESPVSAEEGTAISFKNPTPSDLPKNAYQDPKAARNACLQSLGVTAFFVVLVGSLTFLLLWFRNEVIDYFFDRTGHEGFSNAVPGILNGILITVFDSIWRSVSMILTQRENHRTNQLFENSLVFKRFAFQFVSNCKLRAPFMIAMAHCGNSLALTLVPFCSLVYCYRHIAFLHRIHKAVPKNKHMPEGLFWNGTRLHGGA